MAVDLSPLFNGWQGFGIGGLPLSLGTIDTFQAGTSTPAATYTTPSGLIANTNPIVLGSDGRPPQEVWLTRGQAYRFVLKDALGTQIFTYDNIVGIEASGGDDSLRTELASTAAGEGAELVAKVAVTAETRSDLKAFDTTKTTLAYLAEADRQGVFQWLAGNYTSRVAADTQEGIYVKATAISAGSGAWVRVVPDDEWHSEWFGLPLAASDGTGSNCDTALAAWFAIAEIDKPSTLRFGPGVFALDAAPPQIGYINAIRGSLGTQPTIIYKRYTEASADRGVFARSNFGGVFSDFSLQGSGAASGGRGLSAVLTGAAPNAGELRFERLNISIGASGATADIFIDGSANTSSAKGYRQIFVTGCKLFGGTGGTSRPAIEAKSVQHLFIDGLIQDKILLKGSSSVPTDDVQMKDVLAAVSGDALQLGTSTSDNVISRVTHSGLIVGSVSSFGGGNTTFVSLNRVTGTVTRSWDVTSCGTGQATHTLKHFGFTLANGADSNFGTQTKLFGSVHVVTNAGDSAIFNLRGTANATLLLAGDAAKWSNTAGTASKVNVFYNGSGYYGIQNNSGASLTFSFLLMGEPTSF